MPTAIVDHSDPERVCGIHSVPREQCCPDRVTVADLTAIMAGLVDELEARR